MNGQKLTSAHVLSCRITFGYIVLSIILYQRFAMLYMYSLLHFLLSRIRNRIQEYVFFAKLSMCFDLDINKNEIL